MYLLLLMIDVTDRFNINNNKIRWYLLRDENTKEYKQGEVQILISIMKIQANLLYH